MTFTDGSSCSFISYHIIHTKRAQSVWQARIFVIGEKNLVCRDSLVHLLKFYLEWHLVRSCLSWKSFEPLAQIEHLLYVEVSPGLSAGWQISLVFANHKLLSTGRIFFLLFLHAEYLEMRYFDIPESKNILHK